MATQIARGDDDPFDGARAATERYDREAQASLAGLGNSQALMLHTRAREALANAQAHANSASDAVRRIGADPMTPRESRRGLALAQVKTTRDAVQQSLAAAEVDLKLLEAVVSEQALPPKPASPERETHLRQDLSIRLAGLNGPDVARALVDIAAGKDRELAGAVMHSTIADAYLARLQPRDAAEAKSYIRVSALEGTRVHGEGRAKMAAEQGQAGIKAAQGELVGQRMLIGVALNEAESLIPSR